MKYDTLFQAVNNPGYEDKTIGILQVYSYAKFFISKEAMKKKYLDTVKWQIYNKDGISVKEWKKAAEQDWYEFSIEGIPAHIRI